MNLAALFLSLLTAIGLSTQPSPLATAADLASSDLTVTFATTCKGSKPLVAVTVSNVGVVAAQVDVIWADGVVAADDLVLPPTMSATVYSPYPAVVPTTLRVETPDNDSVLLTAPFTLSNPRCWLGPGDYSAPPA